MNEHRTCPVCGMSYIYPADNTTQERGAEHRTYHNIFLKRCVFISKFSMSQKQIAQFRTLARPYIIYKITDLPINPDSKKLSMYSLLPDSGFGNQDRFFIVHQRPFFSYFPLDAYGIALINLWEAGFMTRKALNMSDHKECYAFQLTTDGFKALAACIECDLICIPDKH